MLFSHSVASNSLWFHGLQSASLLCPWNFQGKNPGVGCHFFPTIGIDISVITLNINGLNAPAKRYRLIEWIQKQDPYIYCLQETHLRPWDTYRLKVKGWKKIFHVNENQKKTRVAIIISDKIGFKIKNIMR